jgi:hypothetical protein
MLLDAVPIIGVDIWEHAFYIQYKNVKPDVCPYILTNRYITDVYPVSQRHLERDQL